MVVETYTSGPEPAWSDLVSFETHPLIGSAEAAARVQMPGPDRP
jgi:hypothetical protein